MSATALKTCLPGLTPTALIAALATFLALGLGWGAHGFSALTLAILIGILAGNLAPALTRGPREAGLALAQRNFLRIGVALYGFNLSAGELASIGVKGAALALVMMTSTLLLGWIVGRLVLRMDRETTLLTTAGSAICGAAAVMATLPVLEAGATRAAEVRRKASAALATVVLFGTLAMLLYPLLFSLFHAAPGQFGLFVGATVHEVAQVVAIGSSIGPEASHTAVIAKMLRVMLLVPFLLSLSVLQRREGQQRGPITVPWFALGFMACVVLNSTGWLPPALLGALRLAGALLLTLAMAALGLNTPLQQVREAGIRPFLLALVLFVHLTLGGWLIASRLA